jgi:hypothetical protein
MEEIIYDRQLYKQMHARMAMEGQEDMPRTFSGACTCVCWASHGCLRHSYVYACRVAHVRK